ncbi:MAG: helix-turn-helix domain-containing protein [Gaiellaceae bacterium]
MLTVPEAARRANRNPETIRRWIRAGKLRASKVGTQHVIEEADLDEVLDDGYEMLPLPDAWKVEPHIDVVRIIRQARESR